MPRDGALTPADLLGRIQAINVVCLRCNRQAPPVVRLVRIGRDEHME
jgi:hypothetical protein